MSGWPGSGVNTTGMDQDADQLPRADIKQMADVVNAIVGSINAANGPALLDGTGKIPAGYLPIDTRKHYVGEAFVFFGASPPTGCLWAAGQAVSRVTYAELFAVYGTTYGPGDGATTFNLPDLRDRVVIGRGDMGGVAAGRITTSIGNINTAILGTTGGNENLMAHTHAASTTPAGGHDHTYTRGDAVGQVGGGSYPQYLGSSSTQNTSAAPDHVHGVSVAAAGAGNSHNIQPAIVGNWCIQA